MTSPEDVLARYEELVDFCENFSSRTEKALRNNWRCREGCSSCCKLESVCGLEGLVLARGLINRSVFFVGKPGSCCLLKDNLCTVYPFRPLICRTHGLPLTSKLNNVTGVDCCPENLPGVDLSRLDQKLVLDLDVVNDNLMRLNLAFFLLLGKQELADQRFLVRDIKDRTGAATLIYEVAAGL